VPRPIQGLSSVVLLWCALSFSQAKGATLSCDKSTQLRTLVKSCADNLAYAKAGKNCLSQFEAAIASSQGKVAKSLKEAASSDRQSAGLESAKKSYELAISELKDLVKQGKNFELEVANYKNEVVLPDDFGSVTEAGLPAEEFLRHQSCYSETQSLIKQHAKNIRLATRQLELTTKISAGLAQKAFRGESSLKNKDLLPLLQPKNGKTVVPKEAPRAKDGPSDISGTKKK